MNYPYIICAVMIGGGLLIGLVCALASMNKDHEANKVARVNLDDQSTQTEIKVAIAKEV